MTDLERTRALSADSIWAAAVRETGIWMAPYADQVADFGGLIIPKMREALDAARQEGRKEGVEEEFTSHRESNDEARREGIEAAIAVLRERVEAYRAVHDYTAADLLETNADCVRDLLLLAQEVKRD